MRNQIILFLGLLLPAAVSAQIPSMTANTLIKLQKDNVTWLARLDSLSVFLDNSSAGGIYGNGSAGSGSNTLPPGGSTITIPGQFQPLSFTMDCESSYEVTAIRMTTDFTSDDAASKYIVGKSPVDSLEIYNFDGGTIIKETGGTLTLFGDKEIYLYADSISMASVPQRTIAAHLMGQDATGFVRRIQGASSGQILKWNGTAWALAADDTGGGGGGAFTDLTDVPASYTGQSGKVVAVKATEDGLEFIDAGGSGGAPNARAKFAALGTTLTTTETGYDTIRITPSSVDAKIVIAYSIDYVKDSGTFPRDVLTVIRRGNSNGDPKIGNDNYVRSSNVGLTIFNASNIFIDTPNTTSEVVYSLRASIVSGASSITRHRFVAFEVAPAGPAGGGSGPSVITPATITATQDNYAPTGWSTATLVRLSGNSGFQKITGFSAGTAGEIKTLTNVGSFCVYLAPEHASSTAANRISYQEEVVIWPGSSCQIVYDNTISRWMVLLTPSPAYDVPRKTKYHDAGVGRVSTAVTMDEDWDLWGSVTLLAADPSASVPFNAWDMNSGSTASGGSGVMYPHDAGGGARVGLSHIVAKTHVRTPANLSDDTNNYYYFMRLAASPYSGFWNQNNSVGLYYRHSENSGKWFFRSRSSGGTNTEVDTGVTFAVDTEYEIQVSLNAAGNEATAWIDGVVVGRITTNLPTSTSVGWSQQLEKTAGTSARSVKIFRFIGAAVRP